MKDEKESIERELVKKVSELQQQIAATQQERKRAEQLTSSYDGQVKKLKELHCQCQEEAGKLKALLETKEAELSRMLTALQISAAQVSLIPPPLILCVLVALNSSVLRIIVFRSIIELHVSAILNFV